MHTSEGLILKKIAVGEADALYTIYTEGFGKIRALAKGVRKEKAKLRGHLEPLSLSRVSFVEGRNGTPRLTRASLLNFWPRLRERERTLRLALVLAEEVDSECMPGERDPALWGFISANFTALDAASFPDNGVDDFLRNFRTRLSSVMGYGGGAMAK
jgi:DNA repair protein RecO (recombination protein O)